MAIPVTTQITDGDALDASVVDTNFDNIVMEMSGGLDDANMDKDNFTENNSVTFEDDGHDHSGGTKGKRVDIIESQLPLAITGGAHGVVLVEHGTKNVGGAGTEAIVFTQSFNQIPLIMVYEKNSGDAKYNVEGFGTYFPVSATRGYSIFNLDVSGFSIINAEDDAQDYYWIAIGI